MRLPLFLLLASASAPALAQVPVYSATPTAAPSVQRLVVRDSVWRCSGAECVAASSPTRHALVCAGLARKVGQLRRFSVNGTEFSSDQLAACNQSAR